MACYQDQNIPIAESGFLAGWEAGRAQLIAQDPDALLRIWWERAEQKEAGNGDRVICRDSYDDRFEIFTVDDADRVWRTPKVYRVLRAAEHRDQSEAER